MTSCPSQDQARALLGRLPLQETWPQHYMEDERGAANNYCYPCMQRIVDWLERFVELGWISDRRLSEFKWGEDNYEVDSVGDCHYCGAILDAGLSDEGMDMELEHFEDCTPDQLRQAPRHEIGRLMWYHDQETPRGDRVRAVVKRYLEAHGLLETK